MVSPFQKLTVEEDLATNALLALESDTASLQADLQALQAQSASLLTQELEFHGTHAALADEKQHLVALADSAQESYAADLKHLQRLEATNVWSDVFSIGVVKGEGGSRVGSINGLRLGKGGGATPVRPREPFISVQELIFFLRPGGLARDQRRLGPGALLSS